MLVLEGVVLKPFADIIDPCPYALNPRILGLGVPLEGLGQVLLHALALLEAVAEPIQAVLCPFSAALVYHSMALVQFCSTPSPC